MVWPALCRLQVMVLAFDFRGHGASSGRTATFGMRERHDLLAAAQFLDQIEPDLPTGIVGISYGAGVTLQTLPNLANIKAVWLDSPFVNFQAVAQNHFRHLPSPLRDPFFHALTWVARFDSGLDLEATNALPGLHDLQVPLHIVHGEEDDLVPSDGSKELMRIYPGPKEGIFLPATNHFTVMKNLPDYGQRLERFFKKHLAVEPFRSE